MYQQLLQATHRCIWCPKQPGVYHSSNACLYSGAIAHEGVERSAGKHACSRQGSWYRRPAVAKTSMCCSFMSDDGRHLAARYVLDAQVH